jgi:predicted GNAT family acetyltransferase
MDLTVVDNVDEQRFEARAGDAVAGFVRYRRTPEGVVAAHTEVDDAYEGQGVGSTLVRGMLDELRARGEKVVPQCPFVRSFLSKHSQEYGDLVAGTPAS